ncbi:hypothetical protein YC2023_076252 [Brassica napus]|uniref:(rape) hypothetical protein n=1 Tax=Brassica napus TaxID=3708 RepID=A0A816Q3P1_BRANA|nr:unnamed protein product [Brassica napus]
MVCNQFIHFLLINEDFSPPPLTEATVYIWRQGSQEKLRSFFKQRNSSQGKQRSRRASPAPSSPTYGGKIQIFDCLKSQGEPSFYLFGFIMYCNHSCESAKSHGGGVKNTVELSRRTTDLKGDRTLTVAFGRRLLTRRRDWKALKLDKCSGFSLPMDFQHRLNTAVEDHTKRKKTLLSKDLGKVGLNQFFLRNLNPLFLKCLILEMSNIFDFADMS